MLKYIHDFLSIGFMHWYVVIGIVFLLSLVGYLGIILVKELKTGVTLLNLLSGFLVL